MKRFLTLLLLGMLTLKYSNGQSTASLINEQATANYTSGYVSITYGGASKSICSTSFDNDDAKVVCHQLGWGFGTVVKPSDGYTISTGLDAPACTGTEDDILDCSGVEWTKTASCSEAASVNCSSPYTTAAWEQTSGEVRLVNGGSSYGRVEALEAPSTWLPVCDDNWTDEDATVACRQLGYSKGEKEREDKYGTVSGLKWKNNITCTGRQFKLSGCGLRLTTGNCASNTNVNVQCSEQYAKGSIFVEYSWIGRVFTWVDSRWQPVCFYGPQQATGRLLCRAMGLKGLISQYKMSSEDVTSVRGITCPAGAESITECTLHQAPSGKTFACPQTWSVLCINQPLEPEGDKEDKFPWWTLRIIFPAVFGLICGTAGIICWIVRWQYIKRQRAQQATGVIGPAGVPAYGMQQQQGQWGNPNAGPNAPPPPPGYSMAPPVGHLPPLTDERGFALTSTVGVSHPAPIEAEPVFSSSKY